MSAHWDGPGLGAWRPWSPAQAAAMLEGAHVPWCVVGGWAIDLFLGHQTRPHDDIEVAVPRRFFTAVRETLQGTYALHAVGDGEVWRLKPGDHFPDGKHQCWVLEETTGRWRLDIMQEPGDADHWICRRDESIGAPRDEIVLHTADGIPYLAPQAVLLFKAKYARPKDEADLAACLPRLSPHARNWLAEALQRVHPGHAWLEKLEAAV
jgi:hypothetical protein